MGGKQEGWKTQEKNFSPRPTNFFLPNREEKQGEKTALRQFYCNALPLTLHSRPSPNPPKTFVPNPYHLFSSSYLYLQHTVHCSRFSPFSLFSFFFNFFFFQRDLLLLVLIILLIFLLIFWFHMTFKFFSFFLSFSYHVLNSFCLFLSLAKGLMISSPAETGMIFSIFFASSFFFYSILPKFLISCKPIWDYWIYAYKESVYCLFVFFYFGLRCLSLSLTASSASRLLCALLQTAVVSGRASVSVLVLCLQIFSQFSPLLHW